MHWQNAAVALLAQVVQQKATASAKAGTVQSCILE
jgi:hypothetical protein